MPSKIFGRREGRAVQPPSDAFHLAGRRTRGGRCRKPRARARSGPRPRRWRAAPDPGPGQSAAPAHGRSPDLTRVTVRVLAYQSALVALSNRTLILPFTAEVSMRLFDVLPGRHREDVGVFHAVHLDPHGAMALLLIVAFPA